MRCGSAAVSQVGVLRCAVSWLQQAGRRQMEVGTLELLKSLTAALRWLTQQQTDEQQSNSCVDT